MLESGIPADRALATLLKAGHSARLQVALKRVQRGVSLSVALQSAGLLNRFDLNLMRAAEQAGKIGEACKTLAHRIQQQRARISALRAAFWMPNAVLIIGLLAGLFIKTTSDDQTLSQAIRGVLPPFLLTLLAAQLFLIILSVDRRMGLSLLWSTGWVHARVRRFQLAFEIEFYSGLVWLIDAGVTYERAIRLCSTLLSSARFERACVAAAAALADGESLPETLKRYGLVHSPELRHTLGIATQSGTFSNSVTGRLTLARAEYEQILTQENAWFPRLYYLLVLLTVAAMMAP